MSSPALTSVDPQALLRHPGEATSEVLRILLERARNGSRPGRRTDEHVVALAVEGGGMRGAVSAGMCLVLETAGLAAAFDRVYGVSAGALNAAAFVGGQAGLGSTYYQDAASRRVVNHGRLLLGRPVVDFDFLFDELIGARKPLSLPRPGTADLRMLATSLETLSLRVLSDFADARELLQAVRASAALPQPGDTPPVFRGERMADGGIVECVPYESALREGASHVLVLRSRPAGYRRPLRAGLADLAFLRGNPEMFELCRRHGDNYNRQAAELASGDQLHVHQIAVPDDARVIGRLDARADRVAEALRLGAAAAAEAVLAEPISLCWQPVAYRAQPVAAPAPVQRTVPIAWRPPLRFPSLRRAPAHS